VAHVQYFNTVGVSAQEQHAVVANPQPKLKARRL